MLHPGDYLEWLGLDHLALDRFLDKRGVRATRFDHLDLSPWNTTAKNSLIEDPLLLDIARYPACVEAEVALRHLDTVHHKKLIDKWLMYLRSRYLALEKLFVEVSPDAVILVQGYEPLNALARLIAITREVPILSVENTALIDRMLWDDQSGITTNMSLAKNYFWRHDKLIQDGREMKYIDELVNSTRSRKQGEHVSPERSYQHDVGERGPMVLFLGQVYTDTASLFGARGWIDQIEIIEGLAALSRKIGFKLVVKLHPKEICSEAALTGVKYNKLTFRKLCASARFASELESGANVLIDHDNIFDTYSLIDSADVAVTMTSQSGLEAAIRNTPTVCCGDAFYGSLGFTFEAPRPNTLEVELREALCLGRGERACMLGLAKKFAYIYFEDYCVSKNVSSLGDLLFNRCLIRGSASR